MTTDKSRADALTEAERLLLARVNDCTKPIDAADRNGILKLIDRLAACPVEQPAAAPIHEPTIPDELHPDTAKLVRRFARALASKLLAAQRKYGYSDNWMRDGWADECRAELMRHIHKGDPRDVAAYCAFLWHHNESTAPAPADERAAYHFHRFVDGVEMAEGVLIERAPTLEAAIKEAVRCCEKRPMTVLVHAPTWAGTLCGGALANRACSANKTGAEVAAVAWMRADDPRDCISDAKKRDMIEHAGAPGARLAEKYSIALGVITPAQAAEPVAWQYRPIINGKPYPWIECTKEAAQRLRADDFRGTHEVRDLFDTPQPTAQADAREGLTDEQREAIEYAARWLDENVSNRYAYTAAKQLRALLAAHPGQPEPRAEAMETVRVPARVLDLLNIINRDGVLKRAAELQEVYRLTGAVRIGEAS
ncbi:hypothetical protein [Burkholderia multivorans]|uniref:hypothetical protein n=1 Tax=Burkholderia multivorans TaxID=87883 RepID=UPI0020B35F55|nr:hypothetical protein [Burkholderia multivorans]